MMTQEEHNKSVEGKRQPCEVYTRVVGYMRPVNDWNDAKQEEYADRKVFKVD